MRIIGGRFRGLALAPVGAGDVAAHLRPTTDRVRESMFNLLVNGTMGNCVAGARVLDLFAGTGALGLEALSRGAASVSFVENGAKALALLRRNIALTRSEADTQIIRVDATCLGQNPGAPFDLVLLDPPYDQAMGERALGAARAGGFIALGACVMWEERLAPPRVPGLVQRDQRRYGDTVLTLLEAASDA